MLIGGQDESRTQHNIMYNGEGAEEDEERKEKKNWEIHEMEM